MKYILLCAALISCSLFKKSNEKADGHFQLYSHPQSDDVASINSNERRLIIVSTNDLKGQLEAKQESAQDKYSPEKSLISIGGVDVFARYLAILRSQYPQQVLLLDAGNSLSGTLISKSSGAKAIAETFKNLKYDAVTFSANDLAAGPELKREVNPANWVPQLFSEKSTPVVLSNLLNLKTTKPVEWGSTTPQLIKEINGIKVGIIGLLSDDLPAKLDAGVLNGLYVESSTQALFKQSRNLRLKGAEVIVLMMHGGLKCGVERAHSKNLPLGKVNFNPSEPGVCENEGALAHFIEQIPSGSLDLIVTGGGPGKIANIVKGIPVIQAFGNGTSFARIDLVWNVKEKALNPEKMKIHQPVRICHRFFKQTEDCYMEDQSIDHRNLVPATYLNEPIFPDQSASNWMNILRLEHLSMNEPLIDNQETWVLDDEAAQALRVLTHTDAALIGGKSWPVEISRGVLTWRDFYATAAFREKIKIIKISGSDFKKLQTHFAGFGFWSSEQDLESLYTKDQVTIAINSPLWKTQISNWAKKNNLSLSQELSPFVISDSIAGWTHDVVATQASGRSPALPHTQP
ncbi:MAG: hypothetical protein K2P81_06000 [Bacteriovoracaceae bacterium]|nr:hypothetical protein [Bacteriovoracaceae bacterium]